jgi:hypothetical protein
MLARSATKVAAAALLVLGAAQPANAQQPHGNGVEAQSSSATSPHSLPGFAPSATVPGAPPVPSPAWAPTGASGRVAPALSSPSSQPRLQQVRR